MLIVIAFYYLVTKFINNCKIHSDKDIILTESAYFQASITMIISISFGIFHENISCIINFKFP